VAWRLTSASARLYPRRLPFAVQ